MYIELISPFIQGKETYETGMKGEVERCRKALELARNGKKVAVISSGDAGIYAMAGLVLELALSTDDDSSGGNGDTHLPEIDVIPGLPAFVSAASILGAPLMHDFASISLSDLLTPWELIKDRVEAAASADFVIILYNPKSKTRVTQLPEAVEIIRRYRGDDTPVGLVRNSSREDERARITTLSRLPELFPEIDMSSLLIIGNSQSFTSVRGDKEWFITPRGYKV